MNKVVGIIVEYNPFHNGHKYHCEKAKENGDILIAVMSGDFVQRGEPALINKLERTKLALENGVDIVVELPTFYSTQSAEIFAKGAVGILNLLEVEFLVFGSESDNLKNLIDIANIEEIPEVKEELKLNLKQGFSYPTSYSNSLKKYNSTHTFKSNDILGLEYIKAIKFWNSKINPVPIKREQTGYYAEYVSENISSATNIRKNIETGNILKDTMPEVTYSILKKSLENKKMTSLKDFYPLIRYKILLGSEYLQNIQDIEIGYEILLFKSAVKYETFELFFNEITSKRYTIGRIQRILIHILLDITKSETEEVKNKIPYINILGFNEKGQKYLKILRKKEIEVPILTSFKNIQKILSEKELKYLSKNEIASKIYSIINSYENNNSPIVFK